jgi:DNA-binding response OmpR family regulator
MHILIVDDEPAVLNTFALLLRLEGHAVATADSAEVAIPMIPYVDACLIDGLHGSGLGLCAIAEAQGKRAVLCSGDPDTCEKARLLGFGAVEKPARAAEILEALGCEAGVAA